MTISRGIEYAQVKRHFKRLPKFGRATDDEKSVNGHSAAHENNKIYESPWYMVAGESFSIASSKPPLKGRPKDSLLVSKK